MTHAAPGANARTAVVVLNWRRYDLTRECLESLLLLNRPSRLILVDNESETHALALLQHRFPQLLTLPLERNLGYAAAMNVGINAALQENADFVLLLNNDTRATPALLEQLLAMFGMQRDTGIAGPSLRYPPPDARVQSMGIDVNRVTGRIRLRHPDRNPEELYPYPFKVDAVSGAAMLVARGVFEKVGLLDPDFFFYFEDIDLCLRARDAGFSTYLNPNAVAYHQGGATMGDRPVQVYYGLRNQLRLLERHGQPLGAPLDALRRGLVTGMHLGQLVREGRIPPQKGARLIWQGMRDHRAGRTGPYPGGQP